jgi:hypothetical protein
MSVLPAWAGRTPLIRAALTAMTTEFINSRQIEELFGLSSDQARRLIHDMVPMRQGNSLVVDAEDIRTMLSEMERILEIRDLRRPSGRKRNGNRAGPSKSGHGDRPTARGVRRY